MPIRTNNGAFTQLKCILIYPNWYYTEERMISSSAPSSPLESRQNVFSEMVLQTSRFNLVRFAVGPVNEGQYTSDHVKVGEKNFYIVVVLARVSGKLCEYVFDSHEPITVEHLPELICQRLRREET